MQSDCVSGLYHFRSKNLIIIGDFRKTCHDLDHSAGTPRFPDFVPYFLTVKRCKFHFVSSRCVSLLGIWTRQFLLQN